MARGRRRRGRVCPLAAALLFTQAAAGAVMTTWPAAASTPPPVLLYSNTPFSFSSVYRVQHAAPASLHPRRAGPCQQKKKGARARRPLAPRRTAIVPMCTRMQAREHAGWHAHTAGGWPLCWPPPLLCEHANDKNMCTPHPLYLHCSTHTVHLTCATTDPAHVPLFICPECASPELVHAAHTPHLDTSLLASVTTAPVRRPLFPRCRHSHPRAPCTTRYCTARVHACSAEGA